MGITTLTHGGSPLETVAVGDEENFWATAGEFSVFTPAELIF
jgi:hypothetical protein